MSAHEPQSAAPANGGALRQLIMGFRTTQMIYVAAKLGIADRLAEGPLRAEALAHAVGAAPRPLYRLLRALASIGIFAETPERAFALTPMARLLQSDVAGSLRTTALLYGDRLFWDAYGGMLHSVRTGEPAFAHVHGEPLFAHLANNPDAASLFHRAMSGFSEQEMNAILAAHDFSGFAHVVDIGGGQGALVAALLGMYPRMRGTVLDLATVADGAQRLLAEAGVTGRASFIPGDFFGAIPPGGDLYLLKSVIHNWNDADATNILRGCRRAMADDARLIVIERVIPAGNVPSEATLFDINMLVVLGSQERTEPEYRALFDAAGFALARVVPTGSAMSLIEGVPVPESVRAAEAANT
jgi:hypothetical protein